MNVRFEQSARTAHFSNTSGASPALGIGALFHMGSAHVHVLARSFTSTCLRVRVFECSNRGDVCSNEGDRVFERVREEGVKAEA